MNHLRRHLPTFNFVKKDLDPVLAFQRAEFVFKCFGAKHFTCRGILRRSDSYLALHPVQCLLLIDTNHLARFRCTSNDFGSAVFRHEHLTMCARLIQLLAQLMQCLAQAVSFMLLIFGLRAKAGD